MDVSIIELNMDSLVDRAHRHEHHPQIDLIRETVINSDLPFSTIPELVRTTVIHSLNVSLQAQ